MRVSGVMTFSQSPVSYTHLDVYKRQVTINDLLEENKKLEARAKASEQGKMKDRMERACLLYTSRCV